MQRPQSAFPPFLGSLPISDSNPLPDTNGDTESREAQEQGPAKITDDTWTAVSWATLVIVRPQKRGATTQPHQSLDSAALWWLLASGSICRSLAEPGTSVRRLRLSPGVLTWGRGHFLQNRLEGGPRENLGDWAVQSGKYGRALGLDTRALAGLSKASYKGSMSSVLLLKGKEKLLLSLPSYLPDPQNTALQLCTGPMAGLRASTSALAS